MMPMLISGIVSMPVSIIGKSKLNRSLGDGRLDQQSANHRAEDDGHHRQPFDPAVGDYQQAVRQQFSEDAVLGGGVGGGAQADNRIGDQRVHAGEHHQAADDFDAVADEHHPAFGHRVGESADKRGEQDVGNGEKQLEQGFVFLRRMHVAQGENGGDQQGIIGQCGKKLGRQNNVKATLHRLFSGRFHSFFRGIERALSFIP